VRGLTAARIWLSLGQESGIVSCIGPSVYPGSKERNGRVRIPKTQAKRGRKSREELARPQAQMLLRMQLESNPEALCIVRAMLERASEVLRFQESDSRAIVRSVDEALANVIRHAYKGRAGQPIVVTCRRLKGGQGQDSRAGMEIILEDSGVAAEPKRMKSRSLEEIRPGGLGLYFMKQSMDEVEFSRKKGKNELRLVKYLASPKPEVRPEGE